MSKLKNSQGYRYNEGKARWGLVDWDALIPMVQVLEYGCNKYDDHNWKKGLPYVATMESMMRHLHSFMNGQDIDEESGLPHVGHILCNAMFLSYYYQFKKDFDDRFIDENKKDSNTE
jgi:hypothetical protein